MPSALGALAISRPGGAGVAQDIHPDQLSRAAGQRPAGVTDERYHMELGNGALIHFPTTAE